MRKQGPKKVCGIERKRNPNGAQIGTRNRQHFENARKKVFPKRYEKKVPNGMAKYQSWYRTGSAGVLISSRRGVGVSIWTQFFDSAGSALKVDHAVHQAGCGGCFRVQNGDIDLPGSTYPLILDVLGRCQKIMIFGILPDGPTNRTNRAVERQRVEKVTEGSPGTIENRTLRPLDHPRRIPTRRWAEGPAN